MGDYKSHFHPFHRKEALGRLALSMLAAAIVAMTLLAIPLAESSDATSFQKYTEVPDGSQSLSDCGDEDFDCIGSGVGILFSQDSMLAFTIDNGEATVIGFDSNYVGPKTDVVIPAEYNGCPVTYIGNYAFEYCESLESVDIPDSVTSIGDHAFGNCESLASVDIPDSVTSIGEFAFSGCSSLASVVISDSVTSLEHYTFRGCSSLASVDIPDSVTTIEYGAFSECSSLASVDIPDSVTTIDPSAFYPLQFFDENGNELEETAESLAGSAYAGTGDGKLYRQQAHMLAFSVENGEATVIGFDTDYDGPKTRILIPAEYDGCPVKSIGKYAFDGCSSLASVDIPDSVTSIEYGAFSGCTSLASMTIPGSVTSIGNDAFSPLQFLEQNGNELPQNAESLAGYTYTGKGDGKLYQQSQMLAFSVENGEAIVIGFNTDYDGPRTEVMIPEAYNGYPVTSIGDKAFNGCKSLASVVIPGSVESIGYSAFSECKSLASVDIPDSVTYIGDYAFNECSSMTSVTIPDSVESIGYYAFSWCLSLTSVAIPDSVASIGDEAFSWCSSLASVDIPDSVGSIGDATFSHCSSLASVIIPGSVESIEGYAFYECSSLASVIIPGSVTSIESDAFSPLHFYDENGNELVQDAVNLSGYTYTGNGDGNLYRALDGESVNVFSVDGVQYTVTSLDPRTVSVTGYEGSPADLKISGAVEYQGCEYAVTSIGDCAFLECYSMSSVTIPDSVTSIGYSAFVKCSSLSSVTFPESITSIGDWAFAYCSSLTSVTIPGSVTYLGELAFSDCTSLASVTIPESVTSIYEQTFGFCDSLASVNIPGSVTFLDESAFYGLSFFDDNGNELAQNAESLAGYSYVGKGDKMLVRNSGSEIGSTFSADGLLYTVSSLKPRIVSVTGYEGSPVDLTIPGTVEYQGCKYSVGSIGMKAFYRCASLESAVLGDVSTIGLKAFSWCENLKSVEMSDSLSSIAGYAFFGCTSITSIAFPDTLSSVGNSAFGYLRMYDSDARTLIAPDSKNLAGYEFNGTGYGKLVRISEEGVGTIFSSDGLVYRVISSDPAAVAVTGYELIPIDIEIPDAVENLDQQYSVTCIGERAFYGCTSLESIDLGNVTDIDLKAFAWCENLREVTMRESVASIAGYSFFQCVSMAEIDIPGDAAIGKSAFSGLRFYFEDMALDYSALPGYSYSGGGDGKLYRQQTQMLAFVVENGEATVTGFDPDYDGPKKNIVIPSTYDGYPVTTIGESAFSRCESMVSVQIPYSVTAIGMSAFDFCTSLKAIDIPDSVTVIGDGAFFNCNSLKSVKISNSVSCIDKYTFYSCSSLASVTIPDSVVTIGEYAFNGCSSLATLNIGSSLTSIGQFAFNNCKSLNTLVLSDSVESIGYCSFSNCPRLTFVKIPASVTYIDEKAFEGLSFSDEYGNELAQNAESLAGYSYMGRGDGNLSRDYQPEEGDRIYVDDLIYAVTSTDPLAVSLVSSNMNMVGKDLVIPDTLKMSDLQFAVTSIGSSALSNGTMASVSIPDSVTEIGEYAFRYCSSLTKVEIPDSVVSIGQNAFEQCTSLKTVSGLGTLQAIAPEMFNGCSSLTKVVIPDTVTEIGEFAFGDCPSLKSVNIPENVSSIGYCAFDNCTSLPSISIPGSVTAIGSSTFAGCISLTTVKISGSLSSIGWGAFKGCTSLMAINIPESVTTIDEKAFEGLCFFDENGNELAQDAESLAGYDYVGTGDRMLHRAQYYDSVDAFTVDGLTYAIASEPGTVSLIGYEGSPVDLEIPYTVEYNGSAYTVTSIEEATS